MLSVVDSKISSSNKPAVIEEELKKTGDLNIHLASVASEIEMFYFVGTFKNLCFTKKRKIPKDVFWLIF